MTETWQDLSRSRCSLTGGESVPAREGNRDLECRLAQGTTHAGGTPAQPDSTLTSIRVAQRASSCAVEIKCADIEARGCRHVSHRPQESASGERPCPALPCQNSRFRNWAWYCNTPDNEKMAVAAKVS